MKLQVPQGKKGRHLFNGFMAGTLMCRSRLKIEEN
jgi:hypothetical protein